MWGWLPGRLILSGPLVGLGRPGLLLRKQGGWLVLWCLACVVGAGVGLVAWCWHRRHARLVVGCWGCCGRGGLLWWVPLVRACVRVGVACCRGSGAVRPGCPARVGLCVVCPLPGVVGVRWGSVAGVGGLVVNCIVDASILL